MLDKPTALNTFRETFINHLTNSIINNLQELKEGTSSEGHREKQSRNAMELIGTGLGAVSGLGGSVVPIVGPLLQMIPQGVQMAVHKMAKQKRRKELKHLAFKLAKEKDGELVIGEIRSALTLYLEDAAFEISRMFEYQITSRKNLPHIKVMAEDAAERALKYFKKNHEAPFERNHIIKGILYGRSKNEGNVQLLSNKKVGKPIDDQQNGWTTPAVFKLPGLMSGEKLNGRSYQSPIGEMRKKGFTKYGFRRKYLTWSLDKGYEAEETDGKWDEIPEGIPGGKEAIDFFNNYEPYYVRVSGQDIDDYLKEIQPQNKKEITFNEFVAKRYAFNGKVSAIICGLPDNQDFSYGDFSDTVWVHIELRGYDLSHCKFNNASLMYADLSQTKITGASFKNADLRLADLSEIKESKNANFESAKLCRADLSSSLFVENVRFIDADMQSIDVTSTDLSGTDLTGAKLEGTNLYEAARPETLYKRVQGLQEISQRTLQKLKKLEELERISKKIYQETTEIHQQTTAISTDVKEIKTHLQQQPPQQYGAAIVAPGAKVEVLHAENTKAIHRKTIVPTGLSDKDWARMLSIHDSPIDPSAIPAPSVIAPKAEVKKAYTQNSEAIGSAIEMVSSSEIAREKWSPRMNYSQPSQHTPSSSAEPSSKRAGDSLEKDDSDVPGGSKKKSQ